MPERYRITAIRGDGINPMIVAAQLPDTHGMTFMLGCIWIAGLLHLLIAAANIAAFRKFRYLQHLQAAPLIVQQVFIVQNGYIMLVQVGIALLCLCYGSELISGQPMCRAICAFMACFWTLRLLLQLFYYDQQLRQQHKLLDLLFILADSYLATVFLLIALCSSSPRAM